MNGFTGFYQCNNLVQNYEHSLALLFNQAQISTPDSPQNYILTDYFALYNQEIEKMEVDGNRFFLALYGDISNTEELISKYSLDYPARDKNIRASAVLLSAFLKAGTDIFKDLTGDFSFTLFDERNLSLYLVRDSFGCKPMFYFKENGMLKFGTRLKYLLSQTGTLPSISKTGLNEIFSLGPSRTPGNAVYDGCAEVPAGHYLMCTPSGETLHCYYRLTAKPHTDSDEDTLAHNLFLLKKAVKKCLFPVDDSEQVGSLLSGGIDSSIVSALLKQEFLKDAFSSEGWLQTFSFDFAENDHYYQENDFQPSLDRPYVDFMTDFLGSKHCFLSCNPQELFDSLKLSVKAHDLPAMGDVDSSLIFFLSKMPAGIKYVFAGECADEIYGGYPWFHREKMIYADTFPWMPSLDARKTLLKDDFIDYLGMEDYVYNAYHKTLAEIEYLPEENVASQTLRRNQYLSITWFMQTLLNRMERAASFTGLTALCPFVDRELMEYTYNMPWNLKSRFCTPKYALRESCIGLLPEQILYRKKSPYPKTYHPEYEAILKKEISEILNDPSAPLHYFLDKKKVEDYISRPLSYHTPWYGQLMAGPQMLAYLIQVNEWIKEYKISVNI